MSLSIAAGFVAVALETVVRATRSLPFWDQWEVLTTSQALASPFAQHNEHRIAVSRLVFAMDTAFFHGTSHTTVAVTFVLAMLLALAIGRVAVPAREDRAGRALATSFALCTITSLRAWENFTWSFEVPFLSVYVAAVIAFVAIADPRARRRTLLLALAATGVASYSIANGIFVGPLVVVLALLARRPRSHVAFAGVAVAALIAGYMHGYVSTHGHTDPVESITERPLRVVRYLCVYLGSPINRHASVATVIGAFGIIATTWLGGSIVLRRERRASIGYVLPALVALTFGTGFITALGRSDFGLAQAGSSRYATTALLFWTTLILDRITMTYARRPRAFRSWVAIACAVVVVLAVVTPRARSRAFRRSFRILLAESSILANANDFEALHGVYESPDVLIPRIGVLRAERLSIFHAPWSTWRGTPLDRHVARRNDDCVGALDRFTERLAVGGRSILIEGRVRYDEWFVRERRVVFIDERGTVVGYGSSGYGPADGRHPSRGESRILGFLDPNADADAVRAIVLQDDDASGCALGGSLVVRRDAASRSD